MTAVNAIHHYQESDHTSREDVQKLIYQLLFLVGENMSKVQSAYAKSQVDQAVIAQNQADATKIQTDKYVAQLEQLVKEQDQSNIVSIFLKIFFVIGGALAAFLTCGVAGTIGVTLASSFMASPLGNEAISALGTCIGHSLGNSEAAKKWGDIIAKFVVIGLITLCTAGVEGVAGDTSTAGRFFATKMNLIQSLVSSNLLGSLIAELPGSTSAAKTGKEVGSLLLNLILMVGTIGFCAGSVGEEGSAFSQLSKLFGDELGFERIMTVTTGAFGLATGATSVASGSYNIDLGRKQNALAPLTSSLIFGEGFFQVLSQLNDSIQKTYQSLMEGNRVLFDTDFAADWRACAEYQG